MNQDKWKFTELDPDPPDAVKKERGGMMFLLIVGLILLVGGGIFAWKIGLFDFAYFWGFDKHDPQNQSLTRTAMEVTQFFHAPWICGLWMVNTAIRYFCRRR